MDKERELILPLIEDMANNIEVILDEMDEGQLSFSDVGEAYYTYHGEAILHALMKARDYIIKRKREDESEN